MHSASLAISTRKAGGALLIMKAERGHPLLPLCPGRTTLLSLCNHAMMPLSVHMPVCMTGVLVPVGDITSHGICVLPFTESSRGL